MMTRTDAAVALANLRLRGENLTAHEREALDVGVAALRGEFA